MSQITQGRPRPHSWPNNSAQEYGEKWDDKIGKDGTDYNQRGASKLGKSFDEHVQEYPVVIEGAELSPFLNDIVEGVSKSFAEFETRMMDRIDGNHAEASDFDKSLGAAVIDIGQNVNEVGSRVNFLEESVGGIAKSLPGAVDVSYLSKSGLSDHGPAPSQADVMDAMLKAVEANQMDPLEVIKFESTGALSPHIAKSLGLSEEEAN